MRPSEALIFYGRTNEENQTSPSITLPWDYVAQTPSASAIYLGNGYFSMAGHTGTIPTSLTIAGVSYSRDTTFGALFLVSGADSVDMKLFRLTSVPPLPPLPIMIKGVDSDLGQPGTLVGWGRGKGTEVQNGWEWGGSETVAKRWGTNDVAASAFVQGPITGANFTYVAYRIFTNSNEGSDEAGAAFGDSGGAMFQLDAEGVWRLSGSATLSGNPLIFRNSDNFCGGGD